MSNTDAAKPKPPPLPSSRRSCALSVNKNTLGELSSRGLSRSGDDGQGLSQAGPPLGDQDMLIMFSELLTLGTATPQGPAQLGGRALAL